MDFQLANLVLRNLDLEGGYQSMRFLEGELLVKPNLLKEAVRVKVHINDYKGEIC